MVSALPALDRLRRVPGRAVHADLLVEQTLDRFGEWHGTRGDRPSAIKPAPAGNTFPFGASAARVLSTADGERAVRLARASLAAALQLPAGPTAEPGLGGDLPPVFEEPRGVFVTLRRYPSAELRGCIGFPMPVLPLRTALAQAAVSAGMEDPRFPRVRGSELGALTVEVSVLGLPQPLRSTRPEDRVAEVQVGRDGLIVDGYGTSGLLLPQVAPEQGWSSEELLDGTCEKAGLPARAWRDPQVRVRRFEAQVFAERSPGGEVHREGG